MQLLVQSLDQMRFKAKKYDKSYYRSFYSFTRSILNLTKVIFMNNEIPADLLEKMERLSKPLDIDKYIDSGVVSKATSNSKTKFIVNIDFNKLPEDISERIQAVETKKFKDGSSKVVITLNLKILKL